jgi:hypothetical protein
MPATFDLSKPKNEWPWSIATVYLSSPKCNENLNLLLAAPELLAASKRAHECIQNLMKAVPWGKTFELDIAALNETLVLLPNAIAKAEGQP